LRRAPAIRTFSRTRARRGCARPLPGLRNARPRHSTRTRRQPTAATSEARRMMPVIRAPLGTNPGMVPAKAEDLARHLGGRKNGRQWLACCPAHDDATPSLSVGYGFDGRILFHCHAGCSQQAVLDALIARGLWPGDGAKPRLIKPDQVRAAKERRNAGTA